MKRKKRQTKKVYLIREIREIFDKLPVLGKLMWNKVLAHCLEEHAQNFSRPQVIEALWAFYYEINRGNGYFALVPIDTGIFIKVAGRNLESRNLIEAHRKRTAEKDFKRNACHAEYIKADISKHLLDNIIANRILSLSGFNPKIKQLNP